MRCRPAAADARRSAKQRSVAVLRARSWLQPQSPVRGYLLRSPGRKHVSLQRRKLLLRRRRAMRRQRLGRMGKLAMPVRGAKCILLAVGIIGVGACRKSVAGREPAVHRASATPCSSVRAPLLPNPVSGVTGECTSDADCTVSLDGRCDLSGCDPDAGSCTAYCTYDACLTDHDCGTGLCQCRATSRDVNSCRPVDGNCSIDNDCGPTGRGFCSPSKSLNCDNLDYVVGFYCHTNDDECVDDSDCPNIQSNAGRCAWDAVDVRWACATGLQCYDS